MLAAAVRIAGSEPARHVASAHEQQMAAGVFRQALLDLDRQVDANDYASADARALGDTIQAVDALLAASSEKLERLTGLSFWLDVLQVSPKAEQKVLAELKRAAAPHRAWYRRYVTYRRGKPVAVVDESGDKAAEV